MQMEVGSPISLIVFEISHPVRPVTSLNPACEGPKAVDVERSMPFELPQLLKVHISNRPIQEQAIYRAVVAVDAEVHHFIFSGYPLTIKLRRNNALGLGVVILIEGPTTPPHSIGKNGYIV